MSKNGAKTASKRELQPARVRGARRADPADRNGGSEQECDLPTQDEVQAQFDESVLHEEISPCLWIPPEWEELPRRGDSASHKRFVDNSSDAGDFVGSNQKEQKEIEAAVKARIKKGNATRIVQESTELPDERYWPSPFADTRHVDEYEFTEKDLRDMQNQLADFPVLEKLKKIVGPDAPGTARLARIFEWAVYRTSVLMSDLNRGLRNETRYNEAREIYLNFLRDIDDHEPETGRKRGHHHDDEGPAEKKNWAEKLDPRNKKLASGYGRSLKWACIDPVIFGGKIVGTRVVVKWNPHLSSSGVPIYP
jgi:hypothetical protein